MLCDDIIIVRLCNRMNKKKDEQEMPEELPKIVVKKDGTEELFSAEKIEESIKLAVQQTKKLPEDLKTGMTGYCLEGTLNMLRGQKKVISESIRDIIISRFKMPGSLIAESWAGHEYSKKNKR